MLYRGEVFLAPACESEVGNKRRDSTHQNVATAIPIEWDEVSTPEMDKILKI